MHDVSQKRSHDDSPEGCLEGDGDRRQEGRQPQRHWASADQIPYAHRNGELQCGRVGRSESSARRCV